MVHEFVVRDEKDKDVITEIIEVQVPFGESPPKYVISKETGKRAYKNFSTVYLYAPAHMRAGEGSETHAFAKQCLTSKTRKTSLKDVAKNVQAMGRA